MLATRFKLNISANNGSLAHTACSELELFANSDGNDRTTGCSATASSVIGANAAIKCFDDSSVTQWGAVITDFPDCWNEFVLLVPVETEELSSYTIQGWHYTGEASIAMKDFTLAYWDNSSWVTLDERQDETGWLQYEVREFIISPISAPNASGIISLKISRKGIVTATVMSGIVGIFGNSGGTTPSLDRYVLVSTDDFQLVSTDNFILVSSDFA